MSTGTRPSRRVSPGATLVATNITTFAAMIPFIAVEIGPRGPKENDEPYNEAGRRMKRSGSYHSLRLSLPVWSLIAEQLPYLLDVARRLADPGKRPARGTRRAANVAERCAVVSAM